MFHITKFDIQPHLYLLFFFCIETKVAPRAEVVKSQQQQQQQQQMNGPSTAANVKPISKDKRKTNQKVN